MNRLTGIGVGIGLALAVGLASSCAGQDQGLTEERLAAMIDSLLPAIAETSGMPVVRPVAYALQTRDDARAFLERQLDEELGPEELEGMGRAYKALGLLPDTLDLRGLLLELLTEQVVGYYDPSTSRLYVIEGAPAAMAEPVVAHELVHALQDQHTDLDAIVARERGNDRQMAAQAAAEGQAMLVMLALQAARATGQPMDPGALPDLGPMMRPAVEAQNEQFPVFRRAPRLIQETLIFPYIGGAGFVQALFRHRTGDEIPVPFGDRLPQSTEQVLDPEGRYIEHRDPPTELVLGPAGEGWAVVYQNTLGMLETSILLTERLGPEGEEAARGWDGDRYALLRGPEGAQALVWYTVWDDDDAASRFVEHYRRWAGRQSDAPTGGAFRPVDLELLEREGRPVVRVVEAPGGTGQGVIGAPPLARLEEGSVDGGD